MSLGTLVIIPTPFLWTWTELTFGSDEVRATPDESLHF